MKKLVNNSKGNGNIGVFGLLGVVFVTLKLMGYIDWSWVWVTAPFWGGLALAVIILVLMALFTSPYKRW